MPALAHIQLGAILGVFLSHSRVDAVFWPYINQPLTTLKSKISLLARQEAFKHYQVVGNTQVDYIMLIFVALILSSFLVGFASPKKRGLSLAGVVSMAAVVVTDIMFTRPLVSKVIKSGGLTTKVLGFLYQISLLHLGSLAGLGLVAGLMISIEQLEVSDDDEDEGLEKHKTE